MKKKTLSVAFMAAGILLVITGVILKQPAAVLAKAIRICMECIGLG